MSRGAARKAGWAPVAVRLSPAMREALEAYCAQTGQSKSEALEAAIEAFLATEPLFTEREHGGAAPDPPDPVNGIAAPLEA